MALNHGGNDAQKSMGIITMALLSGASLSSFKLLCVGYSMLCLTERTLRLVKREKKNY